MRVLILDMTHGGAILAERFLNNGDDVTCVDVYKIATEEQKKHLSDLGVRVETSVPKEKYDLLASPAHCPDVFLEGAEYKDRLTFSGAVSRFIDKKTFRIEITGVKGKTSTCYVLSHILDRAGKKVFLHSSRGQGPYASGRHDIQKKMSIAPTSLLELPDEGYDVIVAEVSLGGSAHADIAAITNIIEDYGIARKTRKASDAKAEIFTDGTNIVWSMEEPFWEKYGKPLCTYGGRTRIAGELALGRPLPLEINYKGEKRTVRLSADYMSMQYLPAMDLTITICEKMDIPVECVVEGLETFRGVPGRGEISFENGVWNVKERNPGISHISIKRTLSCLKQMNALDSAFAIIDPVSKKVCDKMDSDEIKKVLAEYDVDYVFTDGVHNDVDVPEGHGTVIRFIKEGFQ